MANSHFYFGHHKCATRYIIAICNQVSQLLSLSHIEYHNAGMLKEELAVALKQDPHDFVYITNAKLEYLEKIEGPFKAFHVIRDPRDIIVSGYFSHLNTHTTSGWSELEEIRRKLKSLSQEEGILMEMEQTQHMFDSFYNWNYDDPNILEIKYEDMILSPYRTFTKALFHLGIVEAAPELDLSSIKMPMGQLKKNVMNRLSGTKRKKITVPELLNIAYMNEFEKKTKGRKEGEEDKTSHFRKGIAGDWKNYFTPKITAAFKEKHNSLLIKLGYEMDANW